MDAKTKSAPGHRPGTDHLQVVSIGLCSRRKAGNDRGSGTEVTVIVTSLVMLPCGLAGLFDCSATTLLADAVGLGMGSVLSTLSTLVSRNRISRSEGQVILVRV